MKEKGFITLTPERSHHRDFEFGQKRFSDQFFEQICSTEDRLGSMHGRSCSNDRQNSVKCSTDRPETNYMNLFWLQLIL
jgi:hypothetical protein